MMLKTPRVGFSLVELSIVLVILGLLIGGILSGQSLIRAAELRSVSTEATRYITAVQTFRDKYFALPGDMTNATAFWNTDPGGCPVTPTNTVTKTQTCNGDGDGRITEGTNAEPFRFWQHLANAGLIEGSYTGIYGPGGAYDSFPGLNVPPSKLGNGMWSIRYITLPTSLTGPGRFNGTYGNTLQMGAKVNASWNDSALLKAEELWNIDTKMDDGKPGTGRVIGLAHSDCGGTSNPNNHAADYALSESGKGCYIHALLDHPLQF
jgi:prepilin-type N-terminal cleavage/methylation domain-containing protein